jgi:hypothetical protein
MSNEADTYRTYVLPNVNALPAPALSVREPPAGMILQSAMGDEYLRSCR